MKMRTTFLTMAGLVLLAGCSVNVTSGNTTGNGAAANSAAPANTAATSPGNGAAEPSEGAESGGESGGAVDAAFLTGRWGINGDCAQTMEFRADGTVTPPDGSTYAVSGSTVTVSSPGQPPDPKTVTRTGDDAMTVSGGGMSMNMTRCR